MSPKQPMSVPYMMIFFVALTMTMLVFLAGALSNSKPSGLGVLVWGYTSWLMYRRNNKALVSLYKGLLWFYVVFFPIAIGIMIFSGPDVSRLIDFTLFTFVFLVLITFGVTFFLYKFFHKNLINESKVASKVPDSIINDRHWEQAVRELDGSKHDATWAKALVNAEGDETRAKAAYLKMRAGDLNSRENANQDIIKLTANEADSKPSISLLIWNDFNLVGKISILIIIGLVFYYFYGAVGSRSPMITSNAGPGPLSTLSISVDRNISWQSAVNKLKGEIYRKRISVQSMSVEGISSTTDFLNNPLYTAKKFLSASTVAVIEGQNIWWSDAGKFYIRLYNPSESRLTNFLFALSNGSCSSKGDESSLLSFDISSNPLQPHAYGVYSVEWPFEYAAKFGTAGACGIVTMAVGR